MKFFNCIPTVVEGRTMAYKCNTLEGCKAIAYDDYANGNQPKTNRLEVVGLLVLDNSEWEDLTSRMLESNPIAGADKRELTIYSNDPRIDHIESYLDLNEEQQAIFAETCKVQVFKVVNAETGEHIYTRNAGYDYVREVFMDVEANVSSWKAEYMEIYGENDESEAESVTDYEKHTEFVPGHTYSFGWACDANMTSYIEVVRRTEKTLWFKYQGEVVRRKIYNYNGIEKVRPTGTYSMNPVCSADKNVPQAQGQN